MKAEIDCVEKIHGQAKMILNMKNYCEDYATQDQMEEIKKILVKQREARAKCKEDNTQMRIFALAPPSIDSSSPAFIQVKKGDDASLYCKGSGSPKPTVKWIRVGRAMPNGLHEIESEVVTFSDVSRRHAGTYVCSANNGHGKEASKQIKVNVEYSPEMEVGEVFVHTKTGDKAEIVCRVHAFPSPTVVWVFNGNAISSNERVKIGRVGSRHTLTITKVQPSDFGTFTCQASNTLGTDERTTELSGKPYINILLFNNSFLFVLFFVHFMTLNCLFRFA